jgi:FkbM family methyltransferase
MKQIPLFINIKQTVVRALVRAGVWVVHLLPTKLWIRIREESAIVRPMDYKLPIHICVDSWIENEVRLRSCEKEPGTVEWIEKWFRPGDVFYDIGANVGPYSLVAFRFVGGSIKIYAFEPGFMSFPQLCRNVYLNKGNEAIIPLQVALSDRTSLTAFHYQNLSFGGALHALGDPIDHRGNQFHPVFTIPTLTYRLDDFVRKFGLLLPNHIKIDVDGNELQILRGAGDILRRQELRSILLEVNEERKDAGDMVKLLEASGFVLHSQRYENCLYYRR